MLLTKMCASGRDWCSAASAEFTWVENVSVDVMVAADDVHRSLAPISSVT